MSNIDEKDLMILAMLSKNARAPYTEIARYVNLSDVAVIKRIRKLEGKVIKRYTITIDPRKLGYTIISFVGIDVDPSKLFSVIDVLKSKDYVQGLWLTSGDHTLMAMIWGRDENTFLQINNELSSIDGVKRVCPAVVLKTIKDFDMMFKLD